MPRDHAQYTLIRKDAAGDFAKTAAKVAKRQGIGKFTYTETPSVPRTRDYREITGALRSLLPPQVELHGTNPFLVLRVRKPGSSPVGDGVCVCQCGRGDSCSGGGGGG